MIEITPLDKLGVEYKLYHHKPKQEGGRSSWNLNVHKFEALFLERGSRTITIFLSK